MTMQQPMQHLLAQTNTAFCFVVKLGGEKVAAFTECMLPVIDWEIEEVKEGGLNTSIHQLPGRRKSARFTLKNGISKGELVTWCIKVMTERFVRKTMTVELLDAHLNPIAVWEMQDAYPIKWTGPQLRSDASAIAIQTIEFACGEVTAETLV